MTDIVLSHRIHIAAHQQDAWAVVADYANDERWRTGVSSMVCDPRGIAVPGARTTEKIRLAGRTWHNVAVVTSVAPFARLTWETISGAKARGARRVEPTNSGCLVTLELTVVPTGALQSLASPSLRRLLDRNMRRDLERLRHLVEATSIARASTPALIAP